MGILVIRRIVCVFFYKEGKGRTIKIDLYFDSLSNFCFKKNEMHLNSHNSIVNFLSVMTFTNKINNHNSLINFPGRSEHAKEGRCLDLCLRI